MTARALSGTVHAPEFPRVEWLNTDRPLSLAGLRGKVVLLDFWTYGCINCMHVIPELKRLEEKYTDELVVVGIHSAKFRNESDTDNIRQVVLRYGVEHPVANDRDFLIWRAYAVRAWPTLVLVDPAGYVVGQKSGEGVHEVFDQAIAAVIAAFDARGEIDRRPLEHSLERDGLAENELSFPGKVLADLAGRRLFVSDTGHNRIVLSDLESFAVQRVLGGRDPGFADGDYAGCRFSHPQGMALSADGGTLYVADTENHALRAVDLAAEQVRTIAGTGRQSEIYPGRSGRALEVELNSPWDVLEVGRHLYAAMAGCHQIWRLDLDAGVIGPWAGSGGEGIADGPLAKATMAQPSGLACDGARMYVADAEASAIRAIDLDGEEGGRSGMPSGRAGGGPEVRTLVGTGLFDFGDRDGTGDAVLLQHCLGIAYKPADGLLYLADTYNSKIKTLDPVSRTVVSRAGAGHGWRDGAEPLFYEPGGLAVAGGIVYVADTNNHAIRALRIDTGVVETVYFRDLRGLLAPARMFSGREVEVAPQRVAPGERLLLLDVALPEGAALDASVPLSVEWSAGELVGFTGGRRRRRLVAPTLPVELPLALLPGREAAVLQVDIPVCDAGGLCRTEQVRVRMPLEIADGASREITLRLEAGGGT
jgi:thiol-disulfide isomerase/thioredoxin